MPRNSARSNLARSAINLRSRDGIALAVALGAITFVGALVGAAVFITTNDARMAANGKRLQQATNVVEAGQAEVIRTWNPPVNNSKRLYPLDSITLARAASPGGTGSYGGKVYKLTSKLYYIDLTGNDTSSTGTNLPGRIGARQRVGLLARVVPLQLDIRAAFTVGGPVTFGGGNVFIDGRDHTPAGWTTCDPLDTALAGVRAKAAGDVVASSGQVTGTPNVLITPTMDSTTFINYGITSYSQLAAAANITLAAGSYAPVPVLAAGACSYVNTNWGDGNTPANPCGAYFPIVRITGNATISGGQGQGMLLVDGDLSVSGTFKYYGVIVVRGKFVTVPGGSPTINGAVLAQSINLSTTAFNGDVNINYSKCAISRTQDATGSAALVRSRSWVRVM